VIGARWRLASLWLSQVGRTLADNCLRVFVVLELAEAGAAASAWHLVTALMLLPAVLLAPINGALGNSLPKRNVLVGAAGFCVAVTALFGLTGGPWLLGWTLVATAAAVYSPTRYALLPAAAADARMPLTRVNGFIEMGAAAAVVGGWVLGAALHGPPGSITSTAVGAAVALNILATLAALPAWFAADVRRPEPVVPAVAGFFRDCGRILREPEARASLFGLAGLRSLLLAMMGALVAVALRGGDFGRADLDRLLGIGLWVAAGAVAGSLLAGVQRHQRRALGLVPLGATGLLAGLLIAAAGGEPSGVMCLFLGIMGGLVNVPLSAKYQASVPADARGNAMAVRATIEYLLVALVAGLFVGLTGLGLLHDLDQLWLVAALAGAATVACWWALGRNTAEQFLEWAIWPFHRVHGHGPGLEHFPAHGPVIIVANHSAWFDPVWLGKVLPGEVTPMMTSLFYDLPVLRPLMKYMVGAIRVPAITYRREAPELKEAIAVLDRGGCLVIFPEGSLRRSDRRPLRQFGQGVWHILQERPDTPVAVCWIEGGWGSFFSYRGGPPMKNKRFDLWRRIDVAVSEPQVIKPEVLAELRATRAYLRQLCGEARHFLGLEPIGPDRLGEDSPEDEKEACADGQPDPPTQDIV
jgi:1-acyl-sn-glycerol-3-phosphate acyltransferase